jgi:hypothetical protein
MRWLKSAVRCLASRVLNLLARSPQRFSWLQHAVIFAFIHQNAPSEWRLIFMLIAGVLFVTGLFFVIFGSAEAQEWGKFNESSVDEETIPETRTAIA